VIERRDFHEIGPGRGDEVDGFFQGTVTTAGNLPAKTHERLSVKSAATDKPSTWLRPLAYSAGVSASS